MKTSGPASLSAGRGLPGEVDCREQTGVREKCRFTNKVLPDPRRSTHPKVYGAAALRRASKKHNPPHSTKTNKQGHPNFSIRAREGGRKWISVAFPPLFPSQAVLTLWMEIHRALWALTERLRTFLACVSTQMMEELNDNSFLRHGACLQLTCQSVPLIPSHTQSIS